MIIYYINNIPYIILYYFTIIIYIILQYTLHYIIYTLYKKYILYYIIL